MTEFFPTFLADYSRVRIAVHSAIIGTHSLSLLIDRLQEFCAVGVSLTLAPSVICCSPAIQVLCVKARNTVSAIYLVPAFFNFFPSREIREEPTDGVALRALLTLVPFIAAESEKHTEFSVD